MLAWIVRTQLGERVWFSDYYGEDALTTTTDPIRVYDPVNPANNVCKTYTAVDRDRLVEAATCWDAVTAARYGTSKSYAVDCWRQLFGPTFRGE